MSVTVRNLSISRGGRNILSGVGFELAQGTALVVRGANGIGKTSLLRVLAGLAPADAGEVSGLGEKAVYAGHLDGIKAQLSVAENLAFWARVFGNSSIGAALTAFELQPLADRPAQYLSAGQKRRLGLARLLVANRPVWLLDEPTVSLDQTNVARFAAIVERHLAAGGSALIASHVDLGLKTETLDLEPFRPATTASVDPFLEGVF